MPIFFSSNPEVYIIFHFNKEIPIEYNSKSRFFIFWIKMKFDVLQSRVSNSKKKNYEFQVSKLEVWRHFALLDLTLRNFAKKLEEELLQTPTWIFAKACLYCRCLPVNFFKICQALINRTPIIIIIMSLTNFS